ncbi:hypothetical protein A3D77_01825 [Candidatus Gottesmanbacteria bacterium RIFCSPHIGHO2_02_FULL_39_11]|uniref:Uncharacterized protein n=1 Tax=Candidatus Gottesmanbacteria bacterium RIFCSPHIGHO2_02_FULL_39_11 TaxID=1798382 RepID=A0A1F5ZUE3_9BACT|nr:MAG: hypothetical protein A3D77_01825 [Candidatus Gottesmanbacteria bacterium RIFCSPHIGHO2_02_FULL_39_11]
MAPSSLLDPPDIFLVITMGLIFCSARLLVKGTLGISKAVRRVSPWFLILVWIRRESAVLCTFQEKAYRGRIELEK